MSAPRAMLTQNRLREVLDYNPTTGVFVWRVRRGCMSAGDQAGRTTDEGYLSICVDGRSYQAHRLAWLHFYGVWPVGNIDHRDTDKKHNWIANLRLATKSQNGANRGANRNNTTGFKGVTLHHSGRYCAAIKKDQHHIYLGIFDTPEQAHAAYDRKATEIFGNFARTR